MAETINTLESLLTELDVMTVQSAGLRMLADGSYSSTLYTDSDNFGMLGGFARVLAAQELYWHNPDIPFVFCNGKSAKQIAKFGPDVPSDAEIYAEEFKRGIAQDLRSQSSDTSVQPPEILLEDTSVNTVASIRELINMSTSHKWQRMGLVSSEYHLPRIKALCGLIFEKLGEQPVDITFISAETVLKELLPGVYDDEIDAAYKTLSAKNRIKNEQQGLDDIINGRYHIGEFQLAPPAQAK